MTSEGNIRGREGGEGDLAFLRPISRGGRHLLFLLLYTSCLITPLRGRTEGEGERRTFFSSPFVCRSAEGMRWEKGITTDHLAFTALVHGGVRRRAVKHGRPLPVNRKDSSFVFVTLHLCFQGEATNIALCSLVFICMATYPMYMELEKFVFLLIHAARGIFHRRLRHG